MAHRRVAVALVFDHVTSAEIDRLRRAVGHNDLDRIAPHVTLVAPMNRPSDHDDDSWSHVQTLAANQAPIALVLGPATTFAPRTMTIHLGVTGEIERLASLREHVREHVDAPPERWPFVPHVTLRQDAPEHDITVALSQLSHVRLEVVADTIRLLEHRPRAGGRAWWRPVATAVMGLSPLDQPPTQCGPSGS